MESTSVSPPSAEDGTFFLFMLILFLPPTQPNRKPLPRSLSNKSHPLFSDHLTITNMTYDEIFGTQPRISGGSIMMAMPHKADLTTARSLANTLLPIRSEITVDDEVTFVYGRFSDFNDQAYFDLSERQREAVGEAMMEYYAVLRAFLSIYTCKAYRRLGLGHVSDRRRW